MEHVSLSSLIDSLEQGTHMHICVAFQGDCGNWKTRCTANQTIHDRPVCLEVKKLPGGLASCYRCRFAAQKWVIRHRKPMAGFCSNGVYEYCRPVIYNDRVVCVIFVGNILTGDTDQRKKLETRIGSALLETMEQSFAPEDCVRTADVLESYICFLFDHYGMESRTFDPLIENIKSFIRENGAYGFTVEEMATAFHYTPKYLGRVFKARTGKSIKEYCNQCKVTQAKKLLKETDLDVRSVALQAGFNSVAYFDRVFYKFTGLPPQQYRLKAGKNFD